MASAPAPATPLATDDMSLPLEWAVFCERYFPAARDTTARR